MDQLIIYTGIDGCGKSTWYNKLTEKYPNHAYDNFDLSLSSQEIIDQYLKYDLLDRFSLLDDLIYHDHKKPRITKGQVMKILEEILKFRPIELNIGINTPREYEFIHKLRQEELPLSYEDSFLRWSEMISWLWNKKSLLPGLWGHGLTINIFWYNKKLSYDEFQRFYDKEISNEE